MWDPSICACNCNKKCSANECLNNCTCLKILVDNLVIAYDEIMDTLQRAPGTVPGAGSISSINKKVTYKIDYCFNCTITLLNTFLLLAIVIAVVIII